MGRKRETFGRNIEKRNFYEFTMFIAAASAKKVRTLFVFVSSKLAISVLGASQRVNKICAITASENSSFRIASRTALWVLPSHKERGTMMAAMGDGEDGRIAGVA